MWGADHEMLHCHYFEAAKCRSCVLIRTPYEQQLAEKQQRVERLDLRGSGEVPIRWHEPFTAGDRGFRNRAKLVVGGVPGDVTLGILGPDRTGVDLRECAIQTAAIECAIPLLAEFLNGTALWPYSVPERRGELKFVHVTAAPDGALMVRFVVRSERAVRRIQQRSEGLRSLLPFVRVASINMLPEHKAVLEGEQEIALWGRSLAMDLGPVTLHLGPQSFFQTNTEVARALYAQVASWIVDLAPASLWDLYCGVGGFALHCAAALQQGSPAARPTEITGVEVSPAAIVAARTSAAEAGIRARFVVADAAEFAQHSASDVHPDVLIVNPPRRGIGATLTEWIERSAIHHVIYSSCNPESLAADLSQMPSFAVREARLFDMFPHTDHLEVAVMLERVPETRPGVS